MIYNELHAMLLSSYFVKTSNEPTCTKANFEQFLTAALSQSLIDVTLFGKNTFYRGNQENRTNHLEILNL